MGVTQVIAFGKQYIKMWSRACQVQRIQGHGFGGGPAGYTAAIRVAQLMKKNKIRVINGIADIVLVAAGDCIGGDMRATARF